MLNALRLNEGFAEELFELRSGLDLGSIDSALQRARQLGLLEKTEVHAWRPTALGQRFLNDLQALFLTEKEGVHSTLITTLSTPA
jgi:oxygen-independent coproporphyrinogen-3 oxidase